MNDPQIYETIYTSLIIRKIKIRNTRQYILVGKYLLVSVSYKSQNTNGAFYKPHRKQSNNSY